MRLEYLVELVIKSIPNPEIIDGLCFSDGSFIFNWRGVRFRVSDSLFVEEYEGMVIKSTPQTDLLEALLLKTHSENIK